MTELIKDKLYAIKVPNETENIYISSKVKPKNGSVKIKEVLHFDVPDNGSNAYGYKDTKDFYLKGYGWRIVGTVTKDTIDFDCEQYLEQEEGLFKNYDALPVDWFDYFKTPGASMRSLIESKGLYFFNPYGENPPHNIGLLHTYQTGHNVMDGSLEVALRWQQAEKNLIQKLLIIEKL